MIHKHLALSDKHLPRDEAMQIGRAPTIVAEHDEVAFVKVPSVTKLDALAVAYPELARLCSLAMLYGCQWIHFDPDLEPEPTLPTFEWV